MTGSATDGLWREGDYWALRYRGRETRLKHAKGLGYLAVLLEHAGAEIHVLELAAEGAPARPAGQLERGADDAAGAGAGLDAQAKAAYRARVDELQEELEQARDWADDERAERAREELDFIARELARAVGLGGRDRPTASPAERSRQNVGRAVHRGDGDRARAERDLVVAPRSRSRTGARGGGRAADGACREPELARAQLRVPRARRVPARRVPASARAARERVAALPPDRQPRVRHPLPGDHGGRGGGDGPAGRRSAAPGRRRAHARAARHGGAALRAKRARARRPRRRGGAAPPYERNVRERGARAVEAALDAEAAASARERGRALGFEDAMARARALAEPEANR